MILTNNDSTQTFFETAGDPNNPSIILLHGIGADHRMWAPQIQAFADQSFHILAPDLLGHGQSSKVNALTLRDWENQINDLLAHFKQTKCILIGVSMGGVIAQSYAVHYPDKISHLVLSDTFGELKTLAENALGFSQVIGFQVYKLLGKKLLAAGMASTYKAPYAQQARKYFSEVSLEIDFDQMILSRKAINQIDAIGKIKADHFPSLVLVGGQFGKFFIEINRKIADNIPHSKFVVLPNSMDPSNLVNPVEFNREVLDFLQTNA